MSIPLKTIKPSSFDEKFGSPKKKELPTEHISSKDLPSVLKWQNGKRYRIVMEGKQVASSEDGVTLEINKIGGELVKSKRFNRKNTNK